MKRSLPIYLLVLLLSIFAFVGNAQEEIPCSSNSDVATFIVVENNTLLNLELIWVNQDCGEEASATIPSGEFVVTPTYVGHVWLIRESETDRQIGDYLVAAETVIKHEINCSLNGSSGTVVNITNNSENTVELYWVDQNCDESSFGQIPAGETFSQGTFDSHVWVLRDIATGSIVDSMRAETLDAFGQ